MDAAPNAQVRRHFPCLFAARFSVAIGSSHSRSQR
jgi:hypothetical protein